MKSFHVSHRMSCPAAKFSTGSKLASQFQPQHSRMSTVCSEREGNPCTAACHTSVIAPSASLSRKCSGFLPVPYLWAQTSMMHGPASSTDQSFRPMASASYSLFGTDLSARTARTHTLVSGGTCAKSGCACSAASFTRQRMLNPEPPRLTRLAPHLMHATSRASAFHCPAAALGPLAAIRRLCCPPTANSVAASLRGTVHRNQRSQVSAPPPSGYFFLLRSYLRGGSFYLHPTAVLPSLCHYPNDLPSVVLCSPRPPILVHGRLFWFILSVSVAAPLWTTGGEAPSTSGSVVAESRDRHRSYNDLNIIRLSVLHQKKVYCCSRKVDTCCELFREAHPTGFASSSFNHVVWL